MLCSKCYEDIPQGKEIQLKLSIICKKCALIERIAKRKVVASCISCLELIYERDTIYIYKKSFNAEVKLVFADFKINMSSSATQCLQCHKK